MAVWEKAKVTATDPGSRIQIDAAGSSSVRILSQSFRSNDGVDFAIVGHGLQIAFAGLEAGWLSLREDGGIELREDGGNEIRE